MGTDFCLTMLDLDLFYGKIKFDHLGFCMGKKTNSGFVSSPEQKKKKKKKMSSISWLNDFVL